MKTLLKIFITVSITMLSVSCIKDKTVENPIYLSGLTYSTEVSSNNKTVGPANLYLEFISDTEFQITDVHTGNPNTVTTAKGTYIYDGNTVILTMYFKEGNTGNPVIDKSEGRVNGNNISFDRLFMFGTINIKKTNESAWKSGATKADSVVVLEDWNTIDTDYSL